VASVRWADLYRWSLVEVEFGIPKKDILDDLDCVDVINTHKYGVNTNNEFSYRHMAIVLSKNIHNSSITVVPLTEAKEGDKDNISRVVLECHKYKYFLYKDTSVLIDNITTIEKKARVTRIILQWVPVPIRRQIQRAMLNSFR